MRKGELTQGRIARVRDRFVARGGGLSAMWKITVTAAAGALCMASALPRSADVGSAPSAARSASPVVQVPLVQPSDGVDPAGPPFLGVVRMHVDADGFVGQVSSTGLAARDTSRILARARRWIWQPAHDS